MSALEQALQAHRNGDLKSAIDGYRHIIKSEPDCAQAWDYLGVALRSSGDLSAALSAGENAVKQDPTSAQAWSNLGNTRAAMGHDEDAVSDYAQALAISSDFAEAWANRGMAEKRLGRNSDAIRSLSHAAELISENAPALNDLGNHLFELSAFENAKHCYQRATLQTPGFTNAWNNLGNTYLQQLRTHDALAAYQQAIGLDPSHSEARNGYAQTLLLSGDFRRGWPAYEARFDKTGTPPKRHFPCPEWAGEPLAGKSVLLYAEQGLGDTIQFLRFAKRLKQKGAEVIVECPKPLSELAATLEGVDQVLDSGTAIPPTDFHAPLMSLPYLLGLTEITDLQSPTPYIACSPRTGADNFCVGVVWAGNPDHVNDANRSMSLSEMAPLRAVPGVELVSLQLGAAQTELDGLTDLGQHFASFSDTSKALAQLDLVITVDTALAHLAGAMGCPCWLLLPYVPDWRWLLGRDDSPWYPSLRLFRQPTQRDWQSVIEKVCAALQSTAETHGSA